MKVLVLGVNGMLGSAVFRLLQKGALEVFGTIRNASSLRFFSKNEIPLISANIDVTDQDTLVRLLHRVRPDVVINCVGLIKQLDAVNDPLVALPINAMMPHRLARLCALIDARVVHISTDCVFSGKKGNYTEADVTDAYDLYGRSKALGELIEYKNAVTLRTSIIGHELNTNNSLVEWFLAQEGSVHGYAKAVFSGLPTWELATIIRDVVIPHSELRGLYHVSAEPIAKFDLLQLIARQYGKKIDIIRDDNVVIDRSLNSDHFRQATHYEPGDWPELIGRMHEISSTWQDGNV